MGIWIDTDMGFDDLAAILVVGHAGLAIDGISLVFGNTPLEQVRRNAAAARRSFGWRHRFFIGRSMPVMGELETAQGILGADGMPTLGLSLPPSEPIDAPAAFEALAGWLSDTEEPRRILALGPLTNIAALLLARPDLAGRIDDLVWMGGARAAGNHTASAEFNAYADPEALAIVLAHDLPLKMVDLEFCRQILVTPDEAEGLRRQGGSRAALIADLTGGFVGIATSRGRPAMAFYDPAAAVAFTRPDLVTFEPIALSVELAGRFTRGRTVVEIRASHASFNAALADRPDAPAIKAVILDALAVEAAR